ncbi:MAG: sigma-54-dependent Fis family transcriptional regulator [Desulfobulbaceae bacterium]|jgi:transcriptional regulator with GAF, ATPase, and Fis domain|nr:MAG: sigma-54-dependent Fis family transcriptional regulator [Desulfobulbaceae bacterium]HKJ14809.1 sigma-54-dependent Fis family transcriptional regulator [Desulfobulbales bacterium]
MKKDTDIAEAMLGKKRIAELKLRLDRVAQSWTAEDYRTLTQFYVKILPKIVGAERCTIYIIEMATDKICSIFGTGLEERQIEPPREGSIVGEVISSGKGVIVNDLDKREGFHSHAGAETGYIANNMICVPITSASTHGITGAIQVLNKRLKGSFNKADLLQLEEVATHLALSIENIIINQEIIRISDQMNREYERFDKEFSFDTLFVAESQAMRDVLDLARLVSKTPVNVLLLGENGSGKELIARMIHEASDRRDQPFVAVNCASIPEHLMESEFFGYEKGAFTGADHSRKGRFEEATGGTLLLDEIADMPLTIQPKFLRAIQEGEGSRLGSNKLIKYDFRIISATNKNLRQELEDGRFREDLFFRLFSVEVQLPPLRDRKGDVVPLALAFLEEISRRFNKKITGFSPELLNLFEDYTWPGNVRQLRSEVERLVALTPENTVIGPEKCSREVLSATPAPARKEKTLGSLSIPDQVKSLEIELIEKALTESSGNRVKAAEALGITRQGLHKKMKRYEIDTTN